VGISFYTFQTMSYAIDIYRGHIAPVKSVFDFGFYVSFFPQLVSGPIVRAADFIPQLYLSYSLTKKEFGTALFWILNGLLKKKLLADYLGVNFVDRIFANPGMYSGFENLMGLYGYSLQVYADFSGYTDMAIGIALLMGFRLPKNFDSPYKATSVANFWKRWHISLSSWLKDYLYIPMGGNRGGTLFTFISLAFIIFFVFLISGSFLILLWILICFVGILFLCRIFPKLKLWFTTNVNMLITMLIGGLWHGASWNFVLWGGLNGLGLIIYKLWNKISPWKNKNKWYNRAWGIFLTFNFISFTRIWFRSGSANTWQSMQEGHNIIAEWFTANTMLDKLIDEIFVPLWFFLFNFLKDPSSIISYPYNFSFAIDFWNGSKPVFIVMLLGFIIHWLPVKTKQWYRNIFATAHIGLQLGFCILTVIAIYQILSSDLQPFIYFQF